MSFSDDEIVVIRRTQIGLRFWPYLRLFNLLIGFASIAISFQIMSADPNVVQISSVTTSIPAIVGISLVVSTIAGWSATSSKLLLKLADKSSQQSDS